MRPVEELREVFLDHMDVLISHCVQYDHGKRHFASEIAINLRVLLSDTPGTENRSLLWQLGESNKEFMDTELSVLQGEKNAFIEPISGLAFSDILFGPEGHYIDWRPSIDLFSGEKRISSPFFLWWKRRVLSAGKYEFTRSKIVRDIANNDRGGHVAQGIEKAYFELTRNDAHGSYETLIRGDAVSDPNNVDPSRIIPVSLKNQGVKLARALLRQIAHEVIVTFGYENDDYKDAVLSLRPPNFSPVLLMFYTKPPAQ